MSTKQRSLGDILQEFSHHRQIMKQELQKVIIGQDEVIEQLFAAIFTRGHCLLEGVPGLAKTLMVSTLARILDVSFNRIQFTPALMPSDIVGTNVLDEDESGRRSFRFVKGPIFNNIVLADEISPDNCRLWDLKTNEKMDKDRFRQGLGRVEEAYQEVARRLGILPESGPADLAGPKIMQ